MRRRRGFTALAVAGLLAAVLVAPNAVFAAPAKAPAAGGTLDLQTWAESGQLIIVTAITVPESEKLPVTVRIPVPEGANVQWAGEVLGGELSADPAREYKLIKSPAGGQYAEFTLEQTRTAQVDADMSVLQVDGSTVSAAFEWIQSVDSPSVAFSVRVPANASDVQMSPAPSGQPDTNEAGERLYSGAPLKLEPGQKQAVSFAYSTATVSPAAAAGDSTDTLVFVLVAALAVAVVVLIVLVVRQRGDAGRSSVAPQGDRTRAISAEEPGSGAADGPSPEDDWGFDDLD